eukprot:1185336-Prorocentrum_minimum.AAC.5
MDGDSGGGPGGGGFGGRFCCDRDGEGGGSKADAATTSATKRDCGCSLLVGTHRDRSSVETNQLACRFESLERTRWREPKTRLSMCRNSKYASGKTNC